MLEGLGWFLFGIVGIAIGVAVAIRPVLIANKKCYVCGRKIGWKGLKRKVHAEGLWYHYVCWVDYAKQEFITKDDDHGV